MSVVTGFIEIVCDGPAEGRNCPDSAAWADSGPAKRLRKRMREAGGWRTALPGGLDRCEWCAAEADGRGR